MQPAIQAGESFCPLGLTGRLDERRDQRESLRRIGRDLRQEGLPIFWRDKREAGGRALCAAVCECGEKEAQM